MAPPPEKGDTMISSVPDVHEREKLPYLPPQPEIREAVVFLERLAGDPAFLEGVILPLLDEVKDAGDWHVARRHDSPDGSYSLQIFVWPPGTRTRIHDHSSWGAYRCLVGSVLEERYKRLDDASTPEHAHLKKIWELRWSREDGASTVFPYDNGIHRVGNTSDDPAISVHLYGPRLGGEIDGRDYDPSRNYVCDRIES